jgi:hypothetical protein
MIARTTERNRSDPLILVVENEFLGRVGDLAVDVLCGVVQLEHSAAGKNTFSLSIYLYIDIVSHCSCTAQSVYSPWFVRHLAMVIPEYPAQQQEAPTNPVVPQIRHQ